MKCRKYTKKDKWINTHFANGMRKELRGNSFLTASMISASVMQGYATQCSIASQIGTPTAKAAALASSQVAIATAAMKLSKKGRERADEIKRKWGVK